MIYGDKVPIIKAGQWRISPEADPHSKSKGRDSKKKRHPGQ
jgi:hypothetical protein